MEPVQHDWTAILEEEGDDPLAPSCMQYLDTSLDVQATFRKFWQVMEDCYRAEGYGDPRSKAMRAGGYCDTVTLNLIATHARTMISPKALARLFTQDASVAHNRRFVLMALAVSNGDFKKDAYVLPATEILNHSTSYLLKKKYPLGTDEGFAGQVALTYLTTGIMERASRFMRYRILGEKSGVKDIAWYSDEKLVEYTLANPEKVQQILDIIIERKSADVELIREHVESSAVALSSGVL